MMHEEPRHPQGIAPFQVWVKSGAHMDHAIIKKKYTSFEV